MARIHSIGEPENKSERRAIRALAEALPDSYSIVHNFELTTGKGLPYEYDIVIVGDFAVWHVEVKGYQGMIRGNARQWILPNNHVMPSPIPLANKKSKILASRLARHGALRKVWVETAVLLTENRARVRLRDDQTRRVIRLDEAADHFTNPGSLPVSTSNIESLQRPIFQALFGDHNQEARPSQKVRQIGLYDIEEKINQTDSRTVFVARHRYIRTRPKTIIKVFHFDALGSEEQKQREIAAIFHDQDAMRLLGAHPNLIETYDMFAWEHNLFVLPTEFIEMGRPLSLLFEDEEEPPMSWSGCVDVILEMARGLAHAHERGVIHRDIRPLNVVVAPEGVVKLVNFDLAKIRGSKHPQAAERLRKRLDPRYTAPEVWRDPHAATPASDVFSLGILFYELITGDLPDGSIKWVLEGAKGEVALDRERLMQRLGDERSPVRMASPEEAVGVIERMTRRRARERYRDTGEVLEDLGILQEG